MARRRYCTASPVARLMGRLLYLTRLLMDKYGDLYGVTQLGGAFGWGVVYKLNKKGVITVLHSFAGGMADGCEPFGTPAMDTDGNLYGTTYLCGSSNDGIVWKVSKNRTETVLHNFSGYPTDGQYPLSGVILDTAGNLYGTTSEGGTFGPGTVYKLNKRGALNILHSFDGTDGENPLGGVADSLGHAENIHLLQAVRCNVENSRSGLIAGLGGRELSGVYREPWLKATHQKIRHT